jgi:hypothetical protein
MLRDITMILAPSVVLTYIGQMGDGHPINVTFYGQKGKRFPTEVQ